MVLGSSRHIKVLYLKTETRVNNILCACVLVKEACICEAKNYTHHVKKLLNSVEGVFCVTMSHVRRVHLRY